MINTSNLSVEPDQVHALVWFGQIADDTKAGTTLHPLRARKRPEHLSE
jgi:hypothetical protein